MKNCPVIKYENGSLKNRKVVNLCPINSDSDWLKKNWANQIEVNNEDEIKKQIEAGEIDTLFLRASDKTLTGFKTVGKLLESCDLKEKGCRLIIVDDTSSNDLVNYAYKQMVNILKLLKFSEQKYSLEEVNYSIYE